MTIDPYVAGALSMTLVLLLCLGVMFAMRDRHWAAAHLVRRTLWCDQHRQTATVEFIERTRTGMTVRWVQSCSLGAAGQRCGQQCRYAPGLEVAGRHGAGAEETGDCGSSPPLVERPGRAPVAELRDDSMT